MARLPNGLVEGVTYITKEDGTINWRAMIKKEHLTINRQYEKVLTEKLKKDFSEITFDEVEDKHLLILLQGIKELANLRGYSRVSPKVEYASESNVIVNTEITWIPNLETDGLAITFGDIGNASFENTNSFGAKYLAAIAANRAFCRAVRNFLGIAIVASDEIDPKDLKQNSSSSGDASVSHLPTPALERAMKSASFSLAEVISLAKENKDKIEGNPDDWASIDKIGPRDILTLLSLIKKIKNS